MFSQSIYKTLQKNELKKFILLSAILFFSLFNYNALRTFKDSFVVPNIGAEAISFIKLFCVVPATILFVLLYIKMTDNMSFRRIYISIALFFVVFFLMFGFILYPNEILIHPEISYLNKLSNTNLDFIVFKIHFSHFKWFFLIYNKWLFAVFYVVAELWSVMSALLFWQLANQVTKTDEAKKFYPLFAFMGSFGTFTVGSLIKVISNIDNTLLQVQTMMSILALTTIFIILIFKYLVAKAIENKQSITELAKIQQKENLGIIGSLKVIFSSSYLGYITILVICYGVTLNLMEGPWKASARELYQNTQDYIYFMAGVNQWMGSISMLFILIGAYTIRRYSWLIASSITPIVFLIAGSMFFILIIFKNSLHVYLSSLFIFDPLILTVYLGMAQVVAGKSSKYALFDPTKEMAYIPIDNQLKSKGKAAVDIIGARLSRSGASFIQALIFIIFPNATYLTISEILMMIFILMLVIWIIAVKQLNKLYLSKLEEVNTCGMDINMNTAK